MMMVPDVDPVGTFLEGRPVAPDQVRQIEEFGFALGEVMETLSLSGDAASRMRRLYRGMNRSVKAHTRVYLEQSWSDCLSEGKIGLAKVLSQTRDMLVSSVGDSAARNRRMREERRREAARESLVDAVAVAQVMYALAASRLSDRDGSSDSWAAEVEPLVTDLTVEQAREYARWIQDGMLDGEEPEASRIAKSAARVIEGRSPRGQGRRPSSGRVDAIMSTRGGGPVSITGDRRSLGGYGEGELAAVRSQEPPLDGPLPDGPALGGADSGPLGLADDDDAR